MGKLRSALCALCLVLLVPLAVRAWRVLPLDTRPLVAEKYAGWSGVLRLWVYEGWSCGSGSLAPWLNGCASRFEKRHPGVYVQAQTVDAGAIAALNDSGILPPDMVLFPPGLLDSPAGLLPLAAPEAVRPALSGCGRWGDGCYAVPVALGGYLWAWNPALLERVPDSWREAGVAPAAPNSEPWRCWSAALLGLCAGRYAPDAPEGAAPDAPTGELDLGLAGAATPAPTPAPDPAASLSCRLPAGFSRDDDAWTRFINGDAPAMPVTQREVRRLQALSAQGRGPDWRLSAAGEPFTDQLACLALVDLPDAEARQALCREYLDCLLEEDSQRALSEAGAFGVTDAASGYDAGDPLAAMDAALRGNGLCAPGCFDAAWRASVRQGRCPKRTSLP